MTDGAAPMIDVQERYTQARIENLRPPQWRNPQVTKTYDLVVLGAGPGGVAAAKEARRLGASVALVEMQLIGGDKLNAGCVPSKAIIRSARAYADMRAAGNFGARRPNDIAVDLPYAFERMRRMQSRLSRLENAQRLAEGGIDVFFGDGRFIESDAIAIGGQTVCFEYAIIATGSRPLTPSIEGIQDVGFFTNESVFLCADMPRRVLMIGGGPLGCELAQTFARLSVSVAIAQHDPMFLAGEERDAAQILSGVLEREGVEIHLNTDVVAVRKQDDAKIATLLSAGQESFCVVDELIVGVGRAPNVENIGLEQGGIEYAAGAGVTVDDWLRTSNERVFAIGDVCMSRKYTHAAEAAAQLAVRNALLQQENRLSGLIIPYCTYTDPEIAHVGLHVREIRERGIPVKTYTVLMQDVDRAVIDGEDEGFVKVHVKEGDDKILGATIVARHAGEMINALSLAVNCNIGLKRLSEVIHAYPTQAEAVKLAADACARDLSTDGVPVKFAKATPDDGDF